MQMALGPLPDMQYQEPLHTHNKAAILEPDLDLLWPSRSTDDVVRRHLAAILLEDPDHRLRVAHLEPLLQLALASQAPCSSGRLQALLTDPATAKIFAVDFSTQVANWRSRVVYLDLPQLSQQLAAAKQQQQQQAQCVGLNEAAEERCMSLQRGSSSGGSDSTPTGAANDQHLLMLDGANNSAGLQSSNGQHQQQQHHLPNHHAVGGSGSIGPQPLMLESIFGSTPTFNSLPPGAGSGPAGAAAQHQVVGSAAQAVPAPGPDSNSHSGHAVGSLFGSSFEVPHAIASCWADHHSSCGSTAKHTALEALAAADACSSIASGSSTRSCFTGMAPPTAAGAAAAATAGAAAGGSSGGGSNSIAAAGRTTSGASRLRNASSCLPDALDGCPGYGGGSNSIDVCTPRSGITGTNGALGARSPLNGGECEEEAEYSEAQLVFGSVSGTGGQGMAAAAAAAAATRSQDADGAVSKEAAGAENNSSSTGATAAAGGPAAGEDACCQGPSDAALSAHGVDWSCISALQQRQQQMQQQAQQLSAAAQHQQLGLQLQQQQGLLFGLDDFASDGPTPRSSIGGSVTTPSAAAAANRARAGPMSAAAAGAMTARRVLQEQAGLRGDDLSPGVASMLLGGTAQPQHIPHPALAAFGGSLSGAFGHAGSAPPVLQHSREHLLMAAAAAAAGSGGNGGFGVAAQYGAAAAATAAQLAESVLLDAERGQFGGLGGAQHLSALQGCGSSYGSCSGLLGVDRGSGGCWGASPAAMQHHLLQQQQQHRQHLAAVAAAAAAAAQNQQPAGQQQQHGLIGSLSNADATVDISFRSDQMLKEQSSIAGSGGAPAKGAGSFFIAAAGASSAASERVMGQQGRGEGAASTAAQRSNSSTSSTSSSSKGGAAASTRLTPRLTGWASVAAREPARGAQGAPSPVGAHGPHQQQQNSDSSSVGAGPAADGHKQQQQGANGNAAGGKGTAAAGSSSGNGGPDACFQGKAVSKLPSRVRSEVRALVNQFSGILKLDDFDDGVVHQLNSKRSEEEAVAAVRHIAHYDLANIQHMAAYLNHLVKHYNHDAAAAAAAAEGGLALGSAMAAAAAAAGSTAQNGNGSGNNALQLLVPGMLGGNGTLGSTVGGRSSGGGGGPITGASGSLGAYGGQIRLASVPVSTKAMLQKLPLKVFKQVELLVQNCAYLEWRHFDAGVIKVLAQLSKLCESDVFEELELLAATDLSNVEYMPAYLNKRLNNKLWSRRKADGHVPA